MSDESLVEGLSTDLRAQVVFGSRLPRLPWATLGLVAVVSTLYFGLSAQAEGDERSMVFWLVIAGAKVNALILGGEWWRLLAAGLLHGTFSHTVVNILGLMLVGWYVENSLGRRTLLVTFFLSTVSGGLLSVALSATPSVGASGGLFGILGAAMADGVRRYRTLPPVVRWYVVGLPSVIGLFSLGFGVVNGTVDNYAHLGGLVTGVATGLLYPWLSQRSEEPLRLFVRLLDVGLLVSFVVVLATVVQHLLVRFDLPETRLQVMTLEGGQNVFRPEGWESGAFREGRCELGQPAKGDEVLCFVDPYYSMLLVGQDEAIMMTPMVLEYLQRSASARKQPDPVNTDRIYWRRDRERGIAMALLAFEPISSFYVPLFSALTMNPDATSE